MAAGGSCRTHGLSSLLPPPRPTLHPFPPGGACGYPNLHALVPQFLVELLQTGERLRVHLHVHARVELGVVRGAEGQIQGAGLRRGRGRGREAEGRKQ